MNTRNRKLLLTAIILILLVLAGVIFYPQLKGAWQKPLGPGLGLPTLTATTLPPATLPPSATTAAQEPQDGPLAQAEPSATAEPTLTPTPEPQPLCGGPEVMYLLGIGADADEGYLYGLSDVIRVARIDFVTPKVTMLSIPRDLWVELPEGVARPGGDPITHSKLNQSYFYGSPGMGYYPGEGAGPGLLARTLDLNFGLRVDHYGSVNMITFEKIVDAVGGIDIYLPTDIDGRPIDDKTEDMGYFYAGQQHFNGNQALRFSRIRKKYNDFTRMDHQNMVMCSLKEKLTEPAVLTRLPKLVSAFKDSVQTDLSPEQISQLICLLPQVKSENLIFTGLPEEIMKPGRIYSPIQKSEVFIMEADFEVIRDYVTRFSAGEWPDQPSEPSCP